MDIQQRTFHKGAIGSDDVKRLIESGDYVDKSLFIKDILHDNHQVLLITRPRRWGKSSNMSLLKTFLELEVDKEGNPLPNDKKTNPVYFTGGIIGEGNKKIANKGLKISQEAGAMEELGQYPVIMINFKDLGGATYEQIVENLKLKMSIIFNQHSYLVSSPQLSDINKKKFSRYLSNEITESETADALRFLLECLFTHFNKKVWVLIDEYDSAIHRAYGAFMKCTLLYIHGVYGICV